MAFCRDYIIYKLLLFALLLLELCITGCYAPQYSPPNNHFCSFTMSLSEIRFNRLDTDDMVVSVSLMVMTDDMVVSVSLMVMTDDMVVSVSLMVMTDDMVVSVSLMVMTDDMVVSVSLMVMTDDMVVSVSLMVMTDDMVVSVSLIVMTVLYLTKLTNVFDMCGFMCSILPPLVIIK